MRVLQQILSPRVQHGEETDFSAEMLRVAGYSGQRFGGGAEQNIVNHFPVLICDARDLFRQREDHVKIFDRQQFCLADASTHFARAVFWHFGQWRLRQVMESSPLPALWGVFSNGEWTDKRACCTRLHALSTLHYGLPFSSSSSLSGGRNLPLRRLGGTTASMASSFSVGSART